MERLLTARLELRPMTLDDVDARAKDPAERARIRQQYLAGTALGWHIVLGERMVGLVGMHHIEGTKAEVAYEIDAALSGQGFATEAVARIVEHAFDDLHLERLEAHIDHDNARSIRLAARVGFVHETADLYVRRSG